MKSACYFVHARFIVGELGLVACGIAVDDIVADLVGVSARLRVQLLEMGLEREEIRNEIHGGGDATDGPMRIVGDAQLLESSLLEYIYSLQSYLVQPPS